MFVMMMMMMGSSALRSLSSALATFVWFELKGFRFFYRHNTLVNETDVQSKDLHFIAVKFDIHIMIA